VGVYISISDVKGAPPKPSKSKYERKLLFLLNL
jgi:hypothetical protein